MVTKDPKYKTKTSDGLFMHSQKTGVPPPHKFKFECVMKNSSIFFQQLLKLGGQFDLDGQGLGHQFLIHLRHL